MELVLAIIVFVVILLIAFLFLYQPDNTEGLVGTIKDLENYIGIMMLSTEKYAFVIATVKGTRDFVQFSGNTKNIQLDFPLITDRQKSMEAAFRTTAKEMDLKIIENQGTGGETFLDIDLKGTTAEISAVARTFMERFFGITQDTKIKYRLNI
ncbi:MAG: hypothetical protein ABSD50_15830 [Smithella sp.]